MSPSPGVDQSRREHDSTEVVGRNVWTSVDGNHNYQNTNVSGQATAIFGDNYGIVVNVFNDSPASGFTAPSVGLERHSNWLVRQNHVLDNYTLETVTRYQDSGPVYTRGHTSQVEHRWYRKEHLGGGFYADVYREERFCDARATADRAVKVLQRRYLQKLGVDYRKELNALIQLSQPQYQHMFIHFFGWYEHYNNIFITMEFAPLKDLSLHIGAGLTEDDSKDIVFQILDGLRVMHSLDFVHRDIKPANIFVFQRPAPAEPQDKWFVKIGDFGITKNTVTQYTTLHTDIGTVGYKAPEIVGLVPTEHDAYYNAKCDIWSLGCLLLEIRTAHAYFRQPAALRSYCSSPDAFLSEALSQARTSTSTFAFAMLRMLLTAEPQKRPHAEQALHSILDWRSASDDYADQLSDIEPHPGLLTGGIVDGDETDEFIRIMRQWWEGEVVEKRLKDEQSVTMSTKNQQASMNYDLELHDLELKFCDKVLRTIMSDTHWIANHYFMVFVDAVPLRLSRPDINKERIDLNTVRRKLDGEDYREVKDFEEDMRLMFRNCFKFNYADEDIYRRGRELEKLFNEEWSKKHEWLASHEPKSALRSSASKRQYDRGFTRQRDQSFLDSSCASGRTLTSSSHEVNSTISNQRIHQLERRGGPGTSRVTPSTYAMKDNPGHSIGRKWKRPRITLEGEESEQ